jgi:hypothetical protein
MVHYMLSVHTGPDRTGAPPTAEQMQETMHRINRLEDELKSTGAWVFSGRLAEADTATVVRAAGPDGTDVLTTDGPYLESKEHIGGFYVIAVADLDAALGWAARVTAIIGAPIEVRPFAGLST